MSNIAEIQNGLDRGMLNYITLLWSVKSHILIRRCNLKPCIVYVHVRVQRGGVPGVRTPLLKNNKNKGFLSNSGPDPLKNYEATKPAFNVGPSSARQRNAIYMAFRWPAQGGPLIVLFVSTNPSST